MSKRILIVAPDFPYPPNHGGRVDIWKRMLALKEMGHDLDLVATVKERPDPGDMGEVRAVADRVEVVARGKPPRGMLGPHPHQVGGRSGLRHIGLGGDYFAVLVEGASCGGILDNPSLRARHAILRVHNDEALYFRKLAGSTRNVVKASYYFMESLRFSAYERSLVRRIENFLFISRDEFEAFRAEHARKNAIFLPPAVTVPDQTDGKIRVGKRVLFIGSLFMPNNRDGVEWYMRDIHPRLRGIDGYRFVVAGNSKGTSLDWLTQGPHGEDVEVHDSPPVLDELYEGAAVFVNPMRFGAGMKIKTVEALSRGVPMVSTSTGAEGTGLTDGEHLYRADDPAQFAGRIREILETPEKAVAMARAAQGFIAAEYDSPVKLAAFLDGL